MARCRTLLACLFLFVWSVSAWQGPAAMASAIPPAEYEATFTGGTFKVGSLSPGLPLPVDVRTGIIVVPSPPATATWSLGQLQLQQLGPLRLPAAFGGWLDLTLRATLPGEIAVVIDPGSGSATAEIRAYATLTGAFTPPGGDPDPFTCRFASQGSPIVMHPTTDQGAAWDPAAGSITLVDRQFAAALPDCNPSAYDDNIVGATSAGNNLIQLGMTLRPTDTTNPSAPPALTRIVVKGGRAGDQAGTAIAGAGDVNGDGLGDLLISAPGADRRGRRNAGSVYVVFGRSETAPINLARLGGDGFRIDGPSRNDWLGGFAGAVAGVGDVNGDGLADLLVSDGGRGYVVFGKRDGSRVDLAHLGSRGYALRGDAITVAGVGDVNGDGRPDVLVQTYDSFIDGPPGAARVIFGRRPTDPVIAGAPTGFKLVSHEKGDFFGAALAGAGDVNADGLADVIGGAPNGGAGSDFSGRVYVVYGKRDGNPVNLQRLGSGGFVIVARGAQRGITVGNSVAGVGDMNGDGFADVAESGDQEDAAVVFGGPRTGIVNVRRLGAAGFLIRRSAKEAPISIAGLGDATGDGIPDIGIGSLRIFSGTGGGAYVLCGKNTNLTLRIPTRSRCNFLGVQGGQGEGRQVAGAGDFNGDGLGDMLVSDEDLDLGGPRSRGTSYVILGMRRP